MAAQKGRSFIAKWRNDDSTGTYTSVSGQRDTTFTMDGETVDITTKDDASTTGALWRKLLAQAGVMSGTLSMSGIFLDAANDKSFNTRMIQNKHVDIQLTLAGSSAGAGGDYLFSGQITSFERTGTYNGAIEFSATVETSGEVTFDPLP
jgi:TP901-1 family phage major tail protein